MEGTRLNWVAGWLGASVGAALTGAGAFGEWTPEIVATFCVVVAIIGFVALRWRRVAFTYNPNSIRGETTREHGKDVRKPWFPVSYSPGETEGPLSLLLRHPASAEVIGVQAILDTLAKPGKWWPLTGKDSPIRKGRRSTRIQINDHHFRAGETLTLLIQNDREDLPASRLRLYRSS